MSIIYLTVYKKSNYKPEPSFLRYYEHFSEWLEKKDTDKPFFCMMHVSDLHTPEIFFSIDSMNLKEVEQELDIMNDYIDTLPHNLKGNIIYLLSMRFVDYCVERIIKDFSNTNYYKDTIIMLSADHGSSFRLWPLREQVVNNLHSENYNIPFIIYNCQNSYANTNFYSTKDMMKTVLEILNIPNDLPGKDVSVNTNSNYMITEYLGSGCPDIYRREIQLAYRDKSYSIYTKHFIDSEDISVFAIYDKSNNYFELNNIIKKINKSKLQIELMRIRTRFNEIKNEINN